MDLNIPQSEKRSLKWSAVRLGLLLVVTAIVAVGCRCFGGC